jgi:two-component system OmpR family sensor kinase
VSLRSRLLISVLILVAGALVVAAVAVYAEQRDYLYSRLDQRVIAAAAPISYALGVDTRLLQGTPRSRRRLHVRRPAPVPPGAGLVGFVPTDTFGEFVGPTGRVLRGPIMASDGEQPVPRPALSRSMTLTHPSDSPRLFTVRSTQGSKYRFRVVAVALVSGAGTIIAAVPLDEIDETLSRLILVEALAVGGVLVLLIGIGWAVIRLALAPLDEFERAANQISEGALSRRVSPANSRTEIGRLGLSLNRMLVRLEQAFAARDHSEEVRRQFIADASHELRTPLASIRGYAELFRLGATPDAESRERAMSRIESEAARMGTLVEDLLVLARLDELPEAERDVVDLSELAARAVADVRAIARARVVGLDAPEPVEVLGDRDQLLQVLANLLTNAAIHTPATQPIEVSVRRESHEAVIEVRDHGSGLPPGAEAQVFERFWRAEGGRRRGPGGSGLGLSIAREIVRGHRGLVEARNHPEGGALFVVRLPASGPPRPFAAPVPGQVSQPQRTSEAAPAGQTPAAG